MIHTAILFVGINGFCMSSKSQNNWWCDIKIKTLLNNHLKQFNGPLLEHIRLILLYINK